MTNDISRRAFIGAASSLAMPAIVRASAPVDGNCDVFFVVGQSNIYDPGVNDPSAPTFSSGNALKYSGGSLVTLSGNAGPMTAFGNTWFNYCGRVPIIVNAAVGGSSLLAAADQGLGNWSASGSLLGNGLSMLGSAMVAILSAGWRPYTNASGSYAVSGTLIALGERDANAYNAAASGVNYANELAAWASLFGRIRAAVGTSGIYLSRVGTDPSVSDNGFFMARSAQDDATNPLDPNAMIMFSDAVNFMNYGLVNPASTIHYTQTGYNLMGATMAQNIRMFFSNLGL